MKFYIHKLGCPKNDVDADYIAARLIAEGHTPVADPAEADSVLVNTCGFILPAKEESIEEILRLGQLKKSTGLKTLYATGCLSQRYGDELLADMPSWTAPSATEPWIPSPPPLRRVVSSRRPCARMSASSAI
jgi:ribosomal protein S12 methylthiotransferase